MLLLPDQSVFVKDFAFPYEVQGQVGKLNQVAAGANTPMLRYKWVNITVDALF